VPSHNHNNDQALGPAVPPAVGGHVPIAPLLDSNGAAALLNVPASWVLAEARADRIPHVRLGRYVRFVAVELQTWCQSRRRGPWRSQQPG
jgi:excisionase family DNA binding protein